MNPTQYAIEQELELLRKRYREEPDKRSIIQLQARVPRLALEVATPKPIKQTPVIKNDLLKAAEKHLL